MGGIQWLGGGLAPWQWTAAAAVPLGIFTLYFLKLKRQPLEVPSTFLWKKSIEDLRVNSFWQRLRKNILLLLQLLLAAAALLALLRPVSNVQATGKHYILALDCSASMNAVEAGGSRLELAKAKAAEFLAARGPGDRAMAIAFADHARVLCSYSDNLNAVRQAVAGVEPTHRRSSLEECLAIAMGLANPQMGGELGKDIFAEAVPATLVVFSDGNFPKLPDVKLGQLSIEYRKIGAAEDNLGIVRLAARRAPAQPDRVEFLGTVRNSGPAAARTVAKLEIDGRALDVQNLEVAAGAEANVVFQTALDRGGVARLSLDRPDALALDNEAWTVVEQRRRVKVAVCGDQNLALRTALETQEMKLAADIAFLPKVQPTQDLSSDAKFLAYDLVIFDRCSPQAPPPCRAAYLGAVPPAQAALQRVELDSPTILNWNAAHPVLRYLALDDVRVAKAFTFPDLKGADKLIDTDKGAVLYSIPRGVFSDLVQTFALIDDAGSWQTDWPLKLSFPLYILNIVRTLGGAEDDASRFLRPGDRISFRADERHSAFALAGPGGKSATLKRDKLGAFEHLDTDLSGVYAATSGDETRNFAVNVFDPDESALKPAEKLEIGGEEQASAATAFQAQREYWKWLALGAVALLALEWHVYNRRVRI